MGAIVLWAELPEPFEVLELFDSTASAPMGLVKSPGGVAKGDPFCDPFRSTESEIWSFTTASSCDAPGAFDGSSP